MALNASIWSFVHAPFPLEQSAYAVSAADMQSFVVMVCTITLRIALIEGSILPKPKLFKRSNPKSTANRMQFASVFVRIFNALICENDVCGRNGRVISSDCIDGNDTNRYQNTKRHKKNIQHRTSTNTIEC